MGKKSKIKYIVQPAIIVFIIILIAYITSFFHFRIDLTSEKRYTLSKATKKILKNLDDVVFVKIYLDGDLNIPFKRLQRNIHETLDEFKVYAKDNLEYEFINPMAEDDPKLRNDVINELYNKGLRPSNILSEDKEGATSEKIVFPGALIVYRGIEIPVNLLKNNPGLSAEENINNSIQSIEYELINKIRSLTSRSTEKVAFVEGHGELDERQVGDITRELSNYFQVDRGKINGQPGILDAYKAVIIAKPTKKFDEKDKFVIDQYIMKGGIILWFIDAVNADLDSLRSGSTVALINELNIDDLLFRYGVRINPDLIQDLQCDFIPVNTALAGNPASFTPFPWLYYPLLNSSGTNPVTRNLNLVEARFANSIDTIEARKKIRKTVLLKSSVYSRIVEVPVLINLEDVKKEPDKKEFRSNGFPVAVLLEGQFNSAFRNRMLNNYFPEGVPDIIDSVKNSKMLVVADGDMIRNDIHVTPPGTMISPLGYDKFTQQTFGNKDFIINAVNYLTDQSGLIQLRSREIKLRLLNRAKIKEQKLKLQLINVALPVVLVILLGIGFNAYRKNKYSNPML